MTKKIEPNQQTVGESAGPWKRRLYNNNTLHTLRFYSVIQDVEWVLQGNVEDFSDSYNSNWTDEDAYGKQDPMAIFSNTRRNISLTSILPAYSIIEAHDILAKCQAIAAGMYPDYTRINGIRLQSTAPLWKIKWGNLITGGKQNYGTAKRSGLLCRIDSFDYTPDLEANMSLVGALRPMVTSISVALTPFHDHTVGTIEKRRLTHFPYNHGSQRLAIGMIESGIANEATFKLAPNQRQSVDSGLMRIIKIQHARHGERYFIATMGKSGEILAGENITPEMAKQLKRHGYKVSETDPRMAGFDPAFKRALKAAGNENMPYSIDEEAFSPALLSRTSEGRKVLKKLKKNYIKRIQQSLE